MPQTPTCQGLPWLKDAQSACHHPVLYPSHPMVRRHLCLSILSSATAFLFNPLFPRLFFHRLCCYALSTVTQKQADSDLLGQSKNILPSPVPVLCSLARRRRLAHPSFCPHPPFWLPTSHEILHFGRHKPATSRWLHTIYLSGTHAR
jgi:hypothetical protein